MSPPSLPTWEPVGARPSIHPRGLLATGGPVLPATSILHCSLGDTWGLGSVL